MFANIPEVKPAMPTPPVQTMQPVSQPEIKPVEDKKEDIEVLDF